MTNNELFYACFFCNLSRLFGSGMLVSISCFTILFSISGFMIQHVSALYPFANSGLVARVRAISVLKRLGASLLVDSTWFLLKKESTGGHTMAKRNGRYGKRTILIDDRMFFWINSMKNDAIVHALTMIVEQWLEKRLKIFMGIDMYVLRAVHHPPCTE